MREHLDAFARHLGGKSPRTVTIYRSVLGRFFAARGKGSDAAPTTAEVESFLTRPRGHGGRAALATRNQEIAAWRAFGKFAVRDLGWAKDPAADIPFAREPRRRKLTILGVGEVRQLFLACAELPDFERCRALAIIAIDTQGGLRVSEIARLGTDQVDVASNLLVGVLGKGGRVDDVPLSAAAMRFVASWIQRRVGLHGPAGPLFPSPRDPSRPMTARSIQRLFVRLRALMGTEKKVTPHTGRHSLGTNLLLIGTDLATVADVLRDADVNVVRDFYLHLVDERRRVAADRLVITIPPELVPVVAEGDLEPVPPVPVSSPANDVAQVLDSHALSELALIPPENDVDVQHGLSDAENAAQRNLDGVQAA
jgi:integrase/recombinase XerD